MEPPPDKKELLNQLVRLEEELKERKASLPAHSLKPSQLMEIEELEEEIEQLKKKLSQL